MGDMVLGEVGNMELLVSFLTLSLEMVGFFVSGMDGVGRGEWSWWWNWHELESLPEGEI